MLTRYHYFAYLLLCLSFTATATTLNNLANIDYDQADFYLLDVTDNGVKVINSVDAYGYQGELYIAITPLFEGLRLKYSLIGNKLSVTYADKSAEFEFEFEKVLSDTGQWFNDGSFIYIHSSILEQLFTTQIVLNTNSLKVDFTGHRFDFPYKTIKNQQKQRQYNNYIADDKNIKTQNNSNAIITIKDQYRLATVPNGYASLEYQANNRKNDYDVIIQTESDLAYHSASITLARNDQDTTSRVLFSRYPQFTGDKILGIWDQYSFGDLWLSQSSLTSSSSRGLGINFSANIKGNVNENMTTSFAKTARPGWDADIYHNGVFLETRVVPADGLMEFNNLEVFYGSNEFKIALYGPFGEQETLYERVSVKTNPLGQGDISYGLSISENDSSLLDLNMSEFDIDAIAGKFSIGLFNNWQLGLSVNLNDIHNPNGGSESYIITNQITFPGWFFQNNTAINSNTITQVSSLATSFFNNDNLTLRYDSQWKKDENETSLDTSSFDANYNFSFGSITNNFSYSYDELTTSKNQRLDYRVSAFYKYFNVSNSLSYIHKNGTEDDFFGALNLTTRVNNDLRFIAYVPYDFSGEETINPELISASILYNYRTENYNHSFSASNRSFFKENLWTLGYNLAVNKPTHQLTLRTQYDSKENWSVRAGITVNFGYDYFNNEMVLSSQTFRGTGSLDVHTYLDRQLNGIPDVLDYNLANVTFSGGQNWESVVTNEDGQARLFGAPQGVTALSAHWETGGSTLNNDYLIYSHPGSLQRVNLPFYLTTEIEFFVVLGNENQTVTLANVPLIASNVSSGDEYTVESDLDGYASFVDLLPGKYNIFVDRKFLREKGLQAEVGGFEFTSPLRGGFVVLPNIELSRSDSGDIGANNLLKVLLDEYNYEPLLYTDNDKLIHLPPKGAMKAPYSSDTLELAVFKETKTQSTTQERKILREKLANAAASSRQFQPGLTNKMVFDTEGENFATAQDNIEVLTTNINQPENINDQVPVVQVSSVEQMTAIQIDPTADLPAQYSNFEETDTNPDLSSGFVVQYAALKSLDIAKTLATTFPNTTQLHIVRKLVNSEFFYCLISSVMPDLTTANQYLSTTEKEGFIVDATQYLDTIWSK
jgi:hypothetical protein